MRYEVRKFNDSLYIVYDTIDKVNISKSCLLIVANEICEDFNEINKIKSNFKKYFK